MKREFNNYWIAVIDSENGTIMLNETMPYKTINQDVALAFARVTYGMNVFLIPNTDYDDKQDSIDLNSISVNESKFVRNDGEVVDDVYWLAVNSLPWCFFKECGDNILLLNENKTLDTEIPKEVIEVFPCVNEWKRLRWKES